MLPLHVPESELWDAKNNCFISCKEQTINMEHSLISISKWESKWHKPFLDKGLQSDEEIISYLECMSLSNVSDKSVFKVIVNRVDLIGQVMAYINDPMSATWFSNDEKQPVNKKEVVTSELIYYWMTAFNIPPEYQKWHLNRLLTLIRICGIKNAPPKKMGRNDIYKKNRSLNAARRHRLGTKG